jgi:general secretion pathway protein B
MSSILKALKKLEHDKAVRRPDSFRIDADILRGAAPRRSSSTGVLLAAIAFFACGVAATYVYMQHAQPPAVEKPAQASTNRGQGDPAATTLAPVDAHLAGEVKIPMTGKSLPHPEHASPVPEKSPASPRLVVQQPLGRRTDPAEIVPRTAAPLEPKPVTAPVPLAPAVTPVKPVLTVHGIAFQDGADSMAVINGITVSKGSMIEGVRVEEILKDRVRFSRGGEKFEIILDKSN